jgi:hypothetical protein
MFASCQVITATADIGECKDADFVELVLGAQVPGPDSGPGMYACR